MSLNNKRKLLITIVDYRWNPVANISVRFETTEPSSQEYFTNNQGQVKLYLEQNFNDTEYVQITVGEVNENIRPIDKEVTIRLNMINQNTGEMYDDERFN
jgi:hypothetical protein